VSLHWEFLSKFSGVVGRPKLNQNFRDFLPLKKKTFLIIMCDMTWYKKKWRVIARGETLYGSVYVTCKNYKICFIYGAQDFCTGHIKYLKLCSTFSQAYSKRWHPYYNEYMIVSNPTQSNLPIYKIRFHLPKKDNIYAWMAM
jgi:hypothetical protein